MDKPGGEGQGTMTSAAGEQPASPEEKLGGEMPPGQAVPGAQNPESAEVKKENNPNTE